MAQREGSVYLLLFIIASVLFIIMTVLFFVGNADRQKLQAEIERQKDAVKRTQDEHRKAQEDTAKLKTLIAGPSAAAEQWPGNEQYVTDLKEKAERSINEVLTDLKEANRTYGHLVEPYGDLQGLFQKLRQSRDDSFAARSAATDAQVKAKEASDQALAELRKQHEEKLQEFADLQSKYEDLDNKTKTEKAELIKKQEQERDECSDKLIALNRQSNFKDNSIRALEAKIEKLLEESRRERSFDEVEPDGQIVNLLGQSGRGWVDLGRIHHLRTGLVFRVFQYIKGGKKQYKGKAEILKVDETTSEVRIVEEVDNLNPIVSGDYISSPFYDPKAEPVFVFAGTELASKDLTREYLVSKMKSYGGQIRDKVDINTDFLVAMKNFENTPEYRTARELGVTVIRERDLLEFIGR